MSHVTQPPPEVANGQSIGSKAPMPSIVTRYFAIKSAISLNGEPLEQALNHKLVAAILTLAEAITLARDIGETK